ncbi:MAG: hypothetical protein V4757_16575 [Pseudomonadota bacterium]
MGIALFTVSSLFAPLQGLVSWFMPAAPQAVRPCQRPAFRPQSLRAGTEPGRAVARTHASRPLRVLRVIEANHAPASAGRMVISGRMADVCAELDRLAALEATRH